MASTPAKPEQKSGVRTVISGILRKKGLIFLNERHVTIDSLGFLTYYHLDKSREVKGKIDLSLQVAGIRFQYAGLRNK